MRILPCGEGAVLAELDTLEAVIGLHATLAGHPPIGVRELVPAARTLLVRFDPATTSAPALAQELAATPPERVEISGGEEVHLSVTYDGEDLPEVARQAGLTQAEVVALHTSATYTVAFCGFAPGFGYCTGLDRRLHLPRLSTPRTHVPAGAVGIAGEFTAVYPRASPGGWLLLGHTDRVLWDLHRDPPALMRPGTRVRFVRAEAP